MYHVGVAVAATNDQLKERPMNDRPNTFLVDGEPIAMSEAWRNAFRHSYRLLRRTGSHYGPMGARQIVTDAIQREAAARPTVMVDNPTSTIEPFIVFETHFERGCVAATAPDSDGDFDGFNLDGELLSFNVTDVTHVGRECFR